MDDRTLDPNTAFELLSNERRRQMLCVLAQHGDELSLKTVATEITARIEDTDPDKIDDETYQNVYVSLYQNHAPRLVDAGVIQYDKQTQTVELVHTARTRELLQLLDGQFTNRWRKAYVAVFGLAVFVGIAEQLGLFPVVVTIWFLPGVLLAGGLVIIGVLQYYTRNRITVDSCGRAPGQSNRERG